MHSTGSACKAWSLAAMIVPRYAFQEAGVPGIRSIGISRSCIFSRVGMSFVGNGRTLVPLGIAMPSLAAGPKTPRCSKLKQERLKGAAVIFLRICCRKIFTRKEGNRSRGELSSSLRRAWTGKIFSRRITTRGQTNTQRERVCWI